MADEDFRFRVLDVFTLTGRGRAVIGSIESGSVRVGDQVRLEGRDDPVGAFEVHGVSGVRVAGWRAGDDVQVALVIPNLPDHARPGDVLTSA